MRGAQRATALTSRLLAFSRRQALDPKPLDVNKFLNGRWIFYSAHWAKPLKWKPWERPGCGRWRWNSNQLETALLNLAINARDAMPNGGKLTLDAANVFLDEQYVRANPEASTGQYVLMCVSDTGHGMSADVLRRAFEPFFTTKEIGQGTGLGLSQVYGFVKQSGGHIKIYSEEGQGTTVKIYLSRLTKKTADKDVEIVEAGGEGEQSEIILVVEDDPDLRTYITDVLRELNYRVLSAANPQAALTILGQDERIDLLLTDIVMPGQNGRELADAARAVRADLPVLFMTGYSRNAVVHQGRLDEGVELLQKPISQAELAQRVRGILDRNRSRKIG